MLYNYLITTFRNLLKRWPYTLINILGLSLGLTCFLLLFAYTSYEKSFENFHKNKDNIYNIVMERYANGTLESKYRNVMPAMGFTIKDEISGIKHMTRFFRASYTNIISTNHFKKIEKKVFFSDADFFKMFSYSFIQGNPKTALSEPYSVVVTESSAKKYFGTTNVLGKSLKIGNDEITHLFKITAVIKDMPYNTEFKFDFLCSFNSLFKQAKWFQKNWVWWAFPTFISLEQEYTIPQIETQFPSYIKKYKKANNDANREWIFSFKNLKEYHLGSFYRNNTIDENKPLKTMHLLQFIALLIVIISWINYINLSTASASIRAKEVGIRKSLGSTKKQIITQFMIEAMVINSLASIIAIILLFVLVTPFGNLLNLQYTQDLITQKNIWLYLISIVSIGILASGIYPAFVLSSFKPIEVLKTKTITTPANRNIRKLLVGLQFFISLALMTCTLIISHQNYFLKNQDLKVDIHKKLIVSRPKFVNKKKFQKQFETFRDRLKTINGVTNASASKGVPSTVISGLAVWRKDLGIETQQVFHVISIDENYLDTYGLELIAGQNFPPLKTSNHKQVIISETMMKKMGFSSPEEAIGQTLGVEIFDDWKISIRGVLKDYSYLNSKQENIGLLLMQNTHVFKTPPHYTLSIDDNTPVNKVKKEARRIFTELYPDDLFEADLLKSFYSDAYIKEDNNQKVFSIFSSLAILLACIGIIGLASFIAFLKTKEINIRVLFGATLKDIAWILSKEFFIILMISVLLIIPVVIYFMNNWLNEFPYHISLQFWHFGLSITIVSGITLFIVGFNVIKVLSPKHNNNS